MVRAWRAAFAGLALVLALVAARGPTGAQDHVRVVASFSILADFARQVGGEAVAVESLVGPNGDAHAYSPSPADAKRLAAARLVLVNGLGFEGWIDRLVKASGTKASIVTASRGITPRETAGEDARGSERTDPHAWQSAANAKVYVANIRDGLIAIDPGRKATYEANAAAYVAKLDALENDIRATIATIPEARRKVITTHDAFGYFGAAYGVVFIAPQGVSTEAEIAARDVAKIVRQIRAQHIPAVFMENVADPRLMTRIAAESGARIGGRLYSDALSEPGGPAATYLDLMRHNVGELRGALAG